MNDEYNLGEAGEKEINQLEKVEPVTKALSSMGTMWKKVTNKFESDRECYICKKHIDDQDEIHIIFVPEDKVDKGLAAFASICAQCNMD